jgi:hypothetical protein
MERIVYGWQTVGVCDRWTAMLVLHSVAQKTGRKSLEESRYDHRLHGVLLVAYGMNCCQAVQCRAIFGV